MPPPSATCSTASGMRTPASPERKRYRGAVIGAGGIARQSHLPALRDAAALRGRVEVVALVDSAVDVPRVEAIPLLGRREQLRDLAPLDFIDICTPTASHLELTLWGLGQGYHVVCEKPVALTRGEADRIAAAARASGRIVMPCHQYRHNPVWMKIKEWLAGGAIGRWHLAEFSVHRTAADPGRVAAGTPWRGTSSAGRGGVLLDHGTHLVYQLLDIAGMPASVSAWTGRLRHAAYDVEDTAALRFEYPGRLVTMFFTWAARARENRIRFVGDAVRTGWLFVPIVLLYGVVCACNAGAWWLSMADEASRPPFWRAYAITVAGFSLNFITPMVNVGGEPFKIAAVAPWLGLRRAAGSVVLYQMLHTLGMLLSFLTAVVLGALLLPPHPAILAFLALAFVVLAALVVLLVTGHRRGGLEGLLDLLHRLPLLDRLARGLEPKRATLAQMDEQITAVYHRHPRRFVQAVALEYLSRSIFMIEYLLIALGVGLTIDYAQAYVIGGLTSLVQNVIFVVPFEVGTKEGSLYLVFQLLGLDPALGVYTAIVSRLRDLAWIGGGLALVWFSGRGAQARAAAP